MRYRSALVLSAVIAALVLGLIATSDRLLRSVGNVLVHKDQVRPVQAIAITLASGGAGALEAADLVDAMIGTRVLVFSRQPLPDELEFVRRGLPAQSPGERQAAQLRQLGLANVTQLVDLVAGSHDEVGALLRWSQREQVRTVALVTTTEHSRRLRRIVDRMNQSGTIEVIVVPAKYSIFNPDSWWTERDGLRSGIVELEKLILEFLMHPLAG